MILLPSVGDRPELTGVPGDLTFYLEISPIHVWYSFSQNSQYDTLLFRLVFKFSEQIHGITFFHSFVFSPWSLFIPEPLKDLRKIKGVQTKKIIEGSYERSLCWKSFTDFVFPRHTNETLVVN